MSRSSYRWWRWRRLRGTTVSMRANFSGDDVVLGIQHGRGVSPNFSASAEKDVTNIVTFYTSWHVTHLRGSMSKMRRYSTKIARFSASSNDDGGEVQSNDRGPSAICQCMIQDNGQYLQNAGVPIPQFAIILIRSKRSAIASSQSSSNHIIIPHNS